MIGKANRGRGGRPIQLLLAGAMLASAGIAQAQQGGMDIKPVPSTPIADGFTFAAVGDLIYLRPMLATVERQAPGLVKLLRDADVAFGNFETSVLDLKTTKASPGAESGGTWMLGAPAIVPDLAKMGFDIVGHANNHTVDWGEQGLLETLDHLEKGGLVAAGTGRTMAAARAPRSGDVCIDLRTVASVASAAESTVPVAWPATDPWLAAVAENRFFVLRHG